MTVAELIAKLQQLDPALPVVCGGFDESGYDACGTVEQVTIVRVARGTHCGSFEKPEDVNPRWGPAQGEPFDAVYIDA